MTDVSSVAINIEGLFTRELKPRTLWIGCGEELERTPSSSLTAVCPHAYRIIGEMWATYKEWTEPFLYCPAQLTGRVTIVTTTKT